MNQIRFVLSYCWIWICFPNIFSSNCHFIFTVSKFFKVSIILSWSRRLFFWSLLNWVSLYNCRWNSWFNLINCNINVICSNWGIWIWFPKIFSSNCHIVRRISEFFMSVILARVRGLISFDLIRWVFTQEKCFIWFAFCVH
jgi:hypothetical protein